MSYGGEVTANELLTALLAGENFSIPDVDLNSDLFKIPGDTDSESYKPVTRLNNEDLTERQVGGAGTFDALMDGFRCHLKEEYEKGRITGAEYTKAYIALTEAAMSNGVQFLLGRDQAFWSAVQAQAQAITARVQLEVTKVQYAALQLEAMIGRANYALTKLRLATEDVTYAQGKFAVDQMLPAQKEGQDLQNDGYTLANQTATYNLSTVLPTQVEGQELQNAGQSVRNIGFDIENQIGTYNLAQLMPLQRTELELRNSGQTIQNNIATYNLTNMLPEQLKLLKEQYESQRAQTQDLRSDTLPVLGSIGKQKELYAQQILSYQRDAEVKAAKLFTDAWITQKTIDEGLVPPNGFTNASLDPILTTLKTVNNLG